MDTWTTPSTSRRDSFHSPPSLSSSRSVFPPHSPSSSPSSSYSDSDSPNEDPPSSAMHTLSTSSRRRPRPRSIQTNTHFSKTISRFPPTPRTPHTPRGRRDSPHEEKEEGFDFGSPPLPRHPHAHDHGLASPMSPDELEEESRVLEGLGSPRHVQRERERENHPSAPLNAFDIRRQNARRSSSPEEPGPMSPDEAAEERAMLGRVEKRQRRRGEPETRRERKVRYRRQQARGEQGGGGEGKEPEAEDWRAAIEGEYSPSPDEEESVRPPEEEERKSESRRSRPPPRASAQAKWMSSGLMHSDVNKPQRSKSRKGKGEGRRAVEPRSRFLRRVQEEDEGPEEHGEGREGAHVESSPEESPAEDEQRPLNQHGHHRDGRRTPSPKPARKASKRRKERGWDEEQYGPAHLSRRPDQEEETKGWSWTAVKHDGSKQCVVAGCIVLAIAVLALAGWAIWCFGTQYHKQGS